MKRLTLQIGAFLGFLASAVVQSGPGTNCVHADWPDPVANEVIPYRTSGLRSGPLLGQVTSSSVRVWLQLQPSQTAAKAEIIYGTQLPLDEKSSRVICQPFTVNSPTRIANLTNLKANQTYFYGVRIAGRLADLRTDARRDWPRFRTLPDKTSFFDKNYNPKGRFNVCFAIGHCASQEPVKSGGQYASTPAYQTLLNHHFDEAMFGIVNGDIIYEEHRDGTLEGVRRNYQSYFERGRSFQNLFRRIPAVFTYDDHDVGWDLHGSGQVGLKDGPHLMRDIGLKAYEEFLKWANYPAAHSAAIRLGAARVLQSDREDEGILFDPTAEFQSLSATAVSTIHLGIYTKSTATRRQDKTPTAAGVYQLKRVLDNQRLVISPKPQPTPSIRYSIGTHHYSSWEIDNCLFLALDTRGERTKRNLKNRADPRINLLGRQQHAWLKKTIHQSAADFIFIISPDPWTIYHTAAHVSQAKDAIEDDKGDGFPSFTHERAELLKFLDAIPKPVLIFTGDVHASASVKITDNVWEIMCGPLGSTGHPRATLGNPPRGGYWKSQGLPVEVRWVTGFPNNVPYQQIRNTYYGIVQVNNILPVARPHAAGYQYVAYDAPQVIVRWHDAYTGRLVYSETISTLDAIRKTLTP